MRCGVVPQVHDEQNPLHVCDAARLWTEPAGPGDAPGHGFGERARTHALIALRGAADAWPPLDRLLEQPVPDEITLDADELVSLLEHGVGALRERGVDVLWPRSLGRDLTTETVLDRAPRGGGTRETPLQDGVLSGDALFAFTWQIALHGDPLTEEEMDQLAAAAAPVLRLRGSWMVVDPATARKARKRLVRTVKPAQAVAAALTGVVQVDDLDQKVVRRRQPAPDPRAAGERGRPRAGAAAGRPGRRAARLPAPRADLARRDDRARAGRLPGRRHGAGQDRHPDRAAPAPGGGRRRRGPAGRPDAGGLPGQPARQLGGGDPPVRARASRSAASTAAGARWTTWPTGSC